MTQKRKLILTAILFGLVFGIGIFTYTRLFAACDELQCIAFPLLANTVKREILEKTDVSYIALYTLPDVRVRVEKRKKLSQSDANILTKITVMRMQGQFETARSPYPGMLSDAITCDKKFDINPRTIQNKTQSLVFFTGFLNNRMQYGSCLDSEIRFKGLNAIIYCQSHQSWYRIEALIPIESDADLSSFTNQLQHISCH